MLQVLLLSIKTPVLGPKQAGIYHSTVSVGILPSVLEEGENGDVSFF